MATKPSESFTFATDANYTSGLATGQPTKVNPAGYPSCAQGFVPGDVYAPEFRGKLFNVLGQWTEWLAAGSSSGGVGKKILEVDDSGSTNFVNLTLTGTASISGSVELDGGVEVNSLMSFEASTSAGIQKRVNRTTLADADATITVAADVYHAAAVPSVERTITLKSTSPAPAEGQSIRVVATTSGGFNQWVFEREDTTELATLGNANIGAILFTFTNGKWVAEAWSGDATITSHTT